MTLNMEKQLMETISMVCSRIRDHQDRLNDDEWVTRVALVDPVLRTLGWDVGDLQLVEVEHNYSRGDQNVDYALWANPLTRQRVEKPSGLVEAKKHSDPVEYRSHKGQVDRYRYYTPCVVLTNGALWKVYRTDPVDFNEGAFLEFRITEPEDNPVGNLLELRTLLVEPDWTLPPDGLGWVPLGAFEPPTGASKRWWQSATGRRPQTIKFPGADKRSVERWPQILVHTANWLAAEGLLDAGRTIVKPGYKATAPLISPLEPSPGQRHYWEGIDGSSSYVYAHLGARDVLRCVKHLLDECDRSPDAVYVQAG